jgi:hypothetical protein
LHKLLIALAVAAILVVIVVVFRLRNRGPRAEDSVEFRRRLLYTWGGRAMIDAMSAAEPTTRPWSAFVTVKDRLRLRDQVMARQDLHRIVDSRDASTREKLIAWNILRELGENPESSSARQVRGVVVETPTSTAPMGLAVYEDGMAMLLDPTGNLNERVADRSTSPLVRQQIEEAQKLTEDVTPIGDLPPASPTTARVTILSFAGMRSKTVDGAGPYASALAALIDRAKSIGAATSATSRRGQN